MGNRKCWLFNFLKKTLEIKDLIISYYTFFFSPLEIYMFLILGEIKENFKKKLIRLGLKLQVFTIFHSYYSKF
jgi:hypothetical protein